MQSSYKAADPRQWLDPFCTDYLVVAKDLASASWWVLVAALAIGVLTGLAALFQGPPPKQGDSNLKALTTGAGTGAVIVAALKDFIQVLAAAPVWIALFGGGVLLFWISAYAVPDYCQPAPPQQQQTGQSPAATIPPGGRGRN